MTNRTITITAAAFLGALLINTHALPAEPADHHHSAGTHKLSLDAGKK